MAIKKILYVDEACLVGASLPAQVIPSLGSLTQFGYRLVWLGQDSPRRKDWYASQGLVFDSVVSIPKIPVGYELDGEKSFVVSPSSERCDQAKEMGLQSLRFESWAEVEAKLREYPRRARIQRQTKETTIEVSVALGETSPKEIKTGIGYFDHMLEQLSKHGGFSLEVRVQGDLQVDEHHTVEDTALAIGEALRRALGDKVGIGRYGFVLPMDEAEAKVSVDLSGRAFFVFKGAFSRERVGELPTEMVPHFFRSFSDALGATLHIEVSGENDHHLVESAFKGLGRALRPALALTDSGLPSTKGLL